MHLKNIGFAHTNTKSIHVFVALCDNQYQGIIPVPKKIGNGQDPDLNLYWGGDYGIRTYFKKSKYWSIISVVKMAKPVLQRLVFKHVTKNYYLIADAYDGRFIKQTTIDFLNSCAGLLNDTLQIGKQIIGIYGNANLEAYIGHDGLMNFRLPDTFNNTSAKQRDCIILACISKTYFGYYLRRARVTPLVWTTGLMCPEAYTLHDALAAYIANQPHEQIRLSAAKAYSKYQKCSLTFAKKLLVSGY